MNESTAINKALTYDISGVLNNTSKAYFDGLQIGSYIDSEGGYYTGLIRSDYDQKLYAIFLAPKGIGDNFGETKMIHSSRLAITGTDHLSDGWMNTIALVAFNDDPLYAGAWSRSLVINGKDDYYLPSRDELEMCYRMLKPYTTANYTGGTGKNLYSVPANSVSYTDIFPTQTSLTDFKTGGTQAYKTAWYWSSTQYCDHTLGSWVQHFGDGTQCWTYKTNGHYVRVVRRVLVQE